MLPLYRSAFANMVENRGIKDATKALQVHFTAAKPPQSLPNESRRLLQNYIEERDADLSGEEADQAAHELTTFYEKYVGDSSQKLGIFVGVLKELRLAVTGEANIMAWWESVVKPVVRNIGYSRLALKDAQEFLVSVMVQEKDEGAEPEHTRMVAKLCNELLDIYITHTGSFADSDHYSARENQQIAQQVENVLCAFGQKQPTDLFHGLSDLIKAAETRMRALTLLTSFLRHQSSRLYQVIQTPLIEQLLKCLMNDTSTVVLSVALTSLIMLLPHIPGSLGSHLPRLFLIYSRLLCWEKFSPLSTAAERNLVTDDRIVHDARDPGDVGIDSSWEKVRPQDGVVESTTPEVTTYFTYLYGLYPLHLMSYIRKPRKFLKSVDFPGVDDFDLDQAVIRSRSDQFRQEHLLHPNFYGTTIEEELADSKWTKMEAAEVVAECHALSLHGRSALAPPGPPPTGKLPDPPAMPATHSSRSRGVSPVQSHASFRSGNSWRNTQSTAVQSSIGGDVESPKEFGTESGDGSGTEGRRPSGNGPSLDDFPRPSSSKATGEGKDEPITNLAYLQRELALMRNQLNFERWHKAQYSQHISQISRKNAKDSTIDAETLNLINANRTLKKQLENVKNSREKASKDAALSRKNSTNLEAHLSERFNKLRKEQEKFMSEREELQRLREESKEYRELLVQNEARELEHSHNLDIMQKDADQMHQMQEMLSEAERKIRAYEFQEFDFEQATHRVEILTSEKKTMQLRLQNLERARSVYLDKIAELEAQCEALEPFDRPGAQQSQNVQAAIDQAVAESQNKLANMKKAHAHLLEKHTDLEMEYQSLKAQLESRNTNDADNKNDNTSYVFRTQRPTVAVDDFAMLPDMRTPNLYPRTHQPSTGYNDFTTYQPLGGGGGGGGAMSTSDPSGRRFRHPVSPPTSDSNPTLQHSMSSGNPGWRSQQLHSRMVERNASMTSGSGSASSGMRSTFNRTKPLSEDGQPQFGGGEGGGFKGSLRSGSGDGSEVVEGGKRKEKAGKIDAKSEVRVFGRGEFSPIEFCVLCEDVLANGFAKGGAQNIKLKSKDAKTETAKNSDNSKPASGGSSEKKGFRRFM